MSTPTQLFSNLCLPDDSSDPNAADAMLFERTTLEERKIIVRDIIASFEHELLPSELFGSDVMERITEAQGERQRSEWMIHDDLKRTMLYFACHEEGAWTFLNSLHNPSTRALAFKEKVDRRLEGQFDAYDEIADNHAQGSSQEVDHWVRAIRRQMKLIIGEVGEDIITRTGSHYRAADILLQTLEKICQRDDELPTTRRSGRRDSSSLGPVPTLYQGMAQDGSIDAILDALETVQERWRRSLGTAESQGYIKRVRDLLVENEAPQMLVDRFEAVIAG
jgi:hypothetical protein